MVFSEFHSIELNISSNSSSASSVSLQYSQKYHLAMAVSRVAKVSRGDLLPSCRFRFESLVETTGPGIPIVRDAATV